MRTQRARAHATGRPQEKGRAARRSPVWARLAGALMIVVSVVAAVGCYVVFSWWLPSDGERYRDYRAAEVCSARDLAQERTDCLSTWHLTVVKTVNKTSKTSSYQASLTDGASWRGAVNFGDPGPLLERLAPGDEVTATAWRRHVVALSKDGVRQNTTGAPRDELQMNAAVGVLAGLVAVQTFVFGAVRLARPRDDAAFRWNPDGNGLFGAMVVICFGVGVCAAWTGIPWWIVPVVAVPLTAWAAWLMRRRIQPRAPRVL